MPLRGVADPPAGRVPYLPDHPEEGGEYRRRQQDRERRLQQLPGPAQFRHLVQRHFEAPCGSLGDPGRCLSGEDIDVGRQDRDDTDASHFERHHRSGHAGLHRTSDPGLDQSIRGSSAPRRHARWSGGRGGSIDLNDGAVGVGERHRRADLRLFDGGGGDRGRDGSVVGVGWHGLRRDRRSERRQGSREQHSRPGGPRLATADLSQGEGHPSQLRNCRAVTTGHGWRRFRRKSDTPRDRL